MFEYLSFNNGIMNVEIFIEDDQVSIVAGGNQSEVFPAHDFGRVG